MKISKSSISELLIFALPVIFGQLAQMLIGAGDMSVASRFSDEALSAIGIAIAFSNPLFIAGLGFIVAISPIVAQRRGERKQTDHELSTIIIFSLLLSVPFAFLSYLTQWIVPYLSYEPQITDMVQRYLKITAISFPGIFLFLGIKEYWQAEEKVILPNLLAMLAVVLNVVFNIVLVFGTEWNEAIGFDGLAYASVFVRSFLGIAILVISFPKLVKRDFFKVDKNLIRDVFKLGYPMSIAFFFEVMAFCIVSILVGQFGVIESAANNIILTIASITFMVPLAVSSAVSVKVGHALGEKNLKRIKDFSQSALILSLGYMSLSAFFMFLVPEFFLTAFSPSKEVSAVAIKILLVVGMFQIFDGAQVTLSGILRGLGISRITTITTFFGYWICGIPLGYFLAHNMGFKALGFWSALAMSLVLVSLLLSWRLKIELNKNDEIFR